MYKYTHHTIAPNEAWLNHIPYLILSSQIFRTFLEISEICALCMQHLLLLGATTSSLLSSLNRLLIRLDSGIAIESAHEPGSSLEGALEVTSSWLTEEVDLDQVTLERALEWNNGLDQQWVGILHVQVHEGHHGNSHQLRFVKGLDLSEIVGVDGCGDKLWLLGGAHWGWLHVFEGCHVYRVC